MRTMQVQYNNNYIAYQGNNADEDKRRVTAAEVSTATGTAAAATTVRGGALKTFKQFGFDTNKLKGISAETTEAIKFAENTASEAKGLWAGLAKNSRRFTDAIIEWGQNVKANKFIKSILESGAYKKTAGFVGGVTALFVFISGVGHMTKKVVNGVSDKSDRFIRLASGEDAQAA